MERQLSSWSAALERADKHSNLQWLRTQAKKVATQGNHDISTCAIEPKTVASLTSAHALALKVPRAHRAILQYH